MKLDAPKLVGITQGESVPSTRFRWSQYVEDLRQYGFEVSELRSSLGAYAPASRIRRPMWLPATMAESLVRTLRANRYDLRFLQRNLTATLCTWEFLLKKPFVFDVDDSIFLGTRGASADRIARSASLIICGNNFLANHFCRHGEVEVLPTAVDTTRFVLRAGPPPSRQVIGWSGTSSGFKYLYAIEPALHRLLDRHRDALVKVVSDRHPVFSKLPPDRVVYEPWHPAKEVQSLQDFTVGLMPLSDDPWTRGKCSFKMLTYMAVGIPVVVSPVGMNVEILEKGECGYSAISMDDWVDAVSSLLTNQSITTQMGKVGRATIETHYAKKIIGPKLAGILNGVLQRTP